jgi:probable rRNA maturation factor
MLASVEVEISDTQTHLAIDRAFLTYLVEYVLRAEGRERASISIAIVDNGTIHAINLRHLAHDWPTDVITFPLGEPDDPVLTGELVISAETAVNSAHELGIDGSAELALYVIHGLLHLCGYNDREGADAEAMRKRQEELLACVRIAAGASPSG